MFPRAFPRVAVIDSGWTSTLPDPRVLSGVSVQERSDKSVVLSDGVHDNVGHGTACSSRIIQMCPHVRLIPVRVFHNDLGATGQELLTAMRWVLHTKVDIVSLSLICKDDQITKELSHLCDALASAGTHVVAAADNATGGGVPAEFASVIGVRAGLRRHMADVSFNADRPIECSADGFVSHPQWRGRFNSIAAATVSGFIAALHASHGPLSPGELRAKMTDVCQPDRVAVASAGRSGCNGEDLPNR